MARFDLFRLPDDQGYVVDVQSNHPSEDGNRGEATDIYLDSHRYQ